MIHAKKFPLFIASLIVCGALGSAPTTAAEMTFPLRAQYETVGVRPISTEDLSRQLAQYTVVDARSEYEFNTLHIEGAVSVPLSELIFTNKIKELSEDSKKPLVFYCNGTTCDKSYKAALRALQAGVKAPLVYDAGIFAWAEANPTKTVLLGKPMQSADQLISQASFEAHLLTPRAFYEQVLASPNAIVIDIRDAAQRAGISLFQMRDVHVPLDNDRLASWIKTAKTTNKPLFFY